MGFVYLDIETTGLNPLRHEAWEVAWAVNTGPIQSALLTHVGHVTDPTALEVGGYVQRYDAEVAAWTDETSLIRALTGATLVAANPAFDAAFLQQRWGVWGEAPWKYRMLDVEAFAMSHLGLHEPKGLAYIAEHLGIEPGNHTATEDVRCLRECHQALCREYGMSIPAVGVS